MALGGFRIRAILSRNTIISVSHPPRQLLTWEYHRRNRTILLYFTRCQQQVLECFWKSDQKSTLIAGFWTHNKCGMSRGSKPVHIGDLHMGLISCLHHGKSIFLFSIYLQSTMNLDLPTPLTCQMMTDLNNHL